MTGFTLVELLIVIAIIGMLAGTAIPSLLSQTIKSRRADGMVELSRVLKHQERYFLNNMTYTTELSKLGFTLDNGAVLSEEGLYHITAATCDDANIARCVQLTATPLDSQKDDGTLSLNSRGDKDWAGNKAGETGWPQ
ncbi:MAG: prepilin-type N-terminal cleavage/methylation domain-containing protein [Granulosicoccus sp.]|nr:prepilin-type N-terminal cleavage/methylation domain-containing protein [Granulosicoccus sp.]